MYNPLLNMFTSKDNPQQANTHTIQVKWVVTVEQALFNMMGGTFGVHYSSKMGGNCGAGIIQHAGWYLWSTLFK